jgi:amidase
MTTHDDRLAYASATELARMIRAGELAPTELLESVIDRIEERNPDLNAVVFKGYDDARAAAAAAERALRSGDAVGPLHGVPTLMKDLFDFKPGWPSTFGGVPALADQVIDAYCMFAERVEHAGAIIVGKTNSPVMGMRGTCDNPLFGPSRNPFDTSKNTGGSSGGSAAAVADGLVPFAEGTDAGGSIRIPAAWCGVYGFKGSWGRVPAPLRPNAFGGTSPFVAEGPITRTVADAALVMSVLAGYDSRDPYALGDAPDMMSSLDADLVGKRIAYSPDFGVYPVDPEVAAAVASAVRAFEEAGAIVEQVDIDIPYDHIELADLWCRMIASINIGAIEELKAAGIDLLGEHRASMPPEYVRRIEAGYELSITRPGTRPGDANHRQRRCAGSARPVRPARDADAVDTTGRQPRRRRHHRPRHRRRGRRRAADRVVHDLLPQLHRSPGRLHPGRHDRRPAPGRHADHRWPLRRRGRAHREPRVRATASVGAHLRTVPCPMTAVQRLTRDRISFFFDGASEPAATISSGDTIIVETEDAHCGSITGPDVVYATLADVVERIGGANPVTGPIAVDGVAPGDLVAIEILEVVGAPVRGFGHMNTTATLVSTFEAETTICHRRGDEVEIPTHRGPVRVPCRPFIGTLGVAPAGEPILSFEQRRDILGNVDLAEVGAGSTIVLRANVPGALVSLGDAHLAQGDAEIHRSAIEAQADVTLRISRLPRGEQELPRVAADRHRRRDRQCRDRAGPPRGPGASRLRRPRSTDASRPRLHAAGGVPGARRSRLGPHRPGRPSRVLGARTRGAAPPHRRVSTGGPARRSPPRTAGCRRTPTRAVLRVVRGGAPHRPRRVRGRVAAGARRRGPALGGRDRIDDLTPGPWCGPGARRLRRRR